jgi:hypothetical protein
MFRSLGWWGGVIKQRNAFFDEIVMQRDQEATGQQRREQRLAASGTRNQHLLQFKPPGANQFLAR